MTAGNVPTTNLNAFYANTTSGTPASPTAIDAAMQDIVQTVNDNYAYAAGLVASDKLSNLGIVNVLDYGAKGDGVTDDTSIIQQALTNYDVVDLRGKSYACGALTVKSNQYLKNGKLICNNISVVITGTNANNVTIENVEIDGKNTCEKGIFINGGTNVVVNKCNIHDLQTINDETIGVYLDNLTFSKVTNTVFNNILGSNVVGDANAASRAIVFNNSTNCLVDKCNIKNVFSTDSGSNGDGIQFIDADAGQSDKDSGNIIRECLITNCTKSAIKIQQSGVLISRNVITSDNTMTSPMSYALRIYACNVIVTDQNRIICDTYEPIIIGNPLVPVLKNVNITNNYISWPEGNFQAAIVINDSQSVQNVLIEGNTILPGSATTEQGVYIRTYAQNIRVVNNKMVNVINAVYVRDISGITAISGTSYRQNLIVANNDCVVVNNLVYEESNYIYDGLVVVDNAMNITSPLSYAQNSVRLSTAQLNNHPIIMGNRIKNSGFADGVMTSGTTANRPSSGLATGLKYFDTTINREIWWNGSMWVDDFNVAPENRGVNVAVSASATTLAITLPTTEPNATYGVYVSTAWNTNCWITGKSTTGFTINFGTAPASASTLDWRISR